MKIICGILTVCLLFCLTACGNTAAETVSPDTGTVSEESSPVVGDSAAEEDVDTDIAEDTNMASENSEAESDPGTAPEQSAEPEDTDNTDVASDGEETADNEPGSDELPGSDNPVELPELSDEGGSSEPDGGSDIAAEPLPADDPEPTDGLDPEPAEESPAENAEEEPAEGEPAPAPTVTVEDALRFVDQDVSALYAAVGRPNSSSYEESCMGDGDDGILYYDDFIVFTYREPDGSAETVIDAE